MGAPNNRPSETVFQVWSYEVFVRLGARLHLPTELAC